MNGPWVWILLGSTILWFRLSHWAWRRRDVHAGGPAAGLFFCVALYTGAYLAGLLTPSDRTDLLWGTTALEYAGLSFLPLLLLRTILEYTDRVHWIHRGYWVAMASLSTLFAILKFTDPLGRWIYQDLTTVVQNGLTLARFEPGPAYWILAAYTQGSLLISLAAIARAWRTSVSAYRGQWIGLTVACLLPAGGHLGYLAGWFPRPGLDPNPFFLTFTLMIVLWVIFRHQFITLAPIARDVLIEQFDEAVLVFDRARRLTDINEAARRLLGIRSEQIGRPADAVLSDWPEVRDFLAGSASRRVIEIRRAGIHWWALRWMPLRKREKDLGTLLLIRDETVRHREETERMTMERKILHLQKAESLADLAGGIAHEFNNLLMAVQGNLDLLKTALPDVGEARHALEDAETAAKRAAGLSRLMLDYSGHGSQRFERIRVAALVREFAESFRGELPAGLALEVRTDAAVDVDGDPDQIRKLLNNLAVNAMEAIDEPARGRIEIRVSFWRELETQIHGEHPAMDLAPGEYALITVADNGRGIDPEWIPRIFDPFFSTRFAGRGLGLAAVQGIAMSHGGAVRVDSERGRGSRFRVYLAAAPAVVEESLAKKDETP